MTVLSPIDNNTSYNMLSQKVLYLHCYQPSARQCCHFDSYSHCSVEVKKCYGMMQRACPPPQQPPLLPAGSPKRPSPPGLPGGRVAHPPAETPPRPPGIAGPRATPKLQLGGLWTSRPPGKYELKIFITVEEYKYMNMNTQA